MQAALAVMAVLILLVYSVYFYNIIRSRPERFEALMLTSLAEWMIATKQAARRNLTWMLLVTVLLEVAYFSLVFIVSENLVFWVISGLFAAFEVFHLLGVTMAMNRFFRGLIPLKQLFNWKVERTSAWLFFTHALLVLIQLAW
ncbi:MAG: hypothetical protein GXX09_11130 [Syntrophomonadaceae bacterium]|nr:hypothetical protein [Syntrophomonadaceae bacterium]